MISLTCKPFLSLLPSLKNCLILAVINLVTGISQAPSSRDKITIF